jgi:hypothetical protein
MALSASCREALRPLTWGYAPRPLLPRGLKYPRRADSLCRSLRAESRQNETLPILPYETVPEASVTALDQIPRRSRRERERCLSGLLFFRPSSLLFLMAGFLVIF